MNVHSEVVEAPFRKRPDPTDLHVGAQIRKGRRMLAMSQEKLGLAVGVTYQQVQKYETGANRCSASMLVKLSEALGVPLPYFFPEHGRVLSMPERFDLATAVGGIRATLKDMDSALNEIARRAG